MGIFATIPALEEIGEDRVQGMAAGGGGPRLYGGHTIAQMLMAAGRTVEDDLTAYAIHTQFPRPAKPNSPLTHQVTRTSTSAGSAIRSVVASQDGKVVAATTLSFQRATPIPFATVIAAPVAPPPDRLRSERALYQGTLARHGLDPNTVQRLPDDIDGRCTDRIDPDAPEAKPPHHMTWLRIDGDAGDTSPLSRAAGIAYLSDFITLEAALRPGGFAWPTARGLTVGTLDHSLWLHRPSDPYAWHLRTAEAIAIGAGRALVRGEMFAADGRMVASYAQMGTFRIEEP